MSIWVYEYMSIRVLCLCGRKKKTESTWKDKNRSVTISLAPTWSEPRARTEELRNWRVSFSFIAIVFNVFTVFSWNTHTLAQSGLRNTSSERVKEWKSRQKADGETTAGVTRVDENQPSSSSATTFTKQLHQAPANLSKHLHLPFTFPCLHLSLSLLSLKCCICNSTHHRTCAISLFLFRPSFTITYNKNITTTTQLHNYTTTLATLPIATWYHLSRPSNCSGQRNSTYQQWTHRSTMTES